MRPAAAEGGYLVQVDVGELGRPRRGGPAGRPRQGGRPPPRSPAAGTATASPRLPSAAPPPPRHRSAPAAPRAPAPGRRPPPPPATTAPARHRLAEPGRTDRPPPRRQRPARGRPSSYTSHTEHRIARIAPGKPSVRRITGDRPRHADGLSSPSNQDHSALPRVNEAVRACRWTRPSPMRSLRSPDRAYQLSHVPRQGYVLNSGVSSHPADSYVVTGRPVRLARNWAPEIQVSPVSKIRGQGPVSHSEHAWTNPPRHAAGSDSPQHARISSGVSGPPSSKVATRRTSGSSRRARSVTGTMSRSLLVPSRRRIASGCARR